jgi:uncharacterized metal-binding protein YceD (DUF177 family)
MQIEFRKVPLQPKNFELNSNSVKFLGSFCKISQKLVKINSIINGEVEVNCYKCGETFSQKIEEDIDFLVSDGICEVDDEKNLDDIIIECENSMIDFDEILNGEVESFQSDYHLCNNCNENDLIKLEF